MIRHSRTSTNSASDQLARRWGAYCERVDEQHFRESILQRIYNQIAKADVVVADMSGKNPNVFYEVGYAHALGKDVILLTQKAEDIPFDLKHHHHVVYGDSVADLLEKLVPRLRWSVNRRQSNNAVSGDPVLQFYVAGTELTEDGEVEVQIEGPQNESGEVVLQIDVHNPGMSPVELDGEALAVVVESSVNVSGKSNLVNLPDGKLHAALPAVGKLMPSGWKTTEFRLRLDAVANQDIEDDQNDPYNYLEFEMEKRLPLELRHYQEFGVYSVKTTCALKALRPVYRTG